MIGKALLGINFNGCISYCMSKKDSEILVYRNCYGNKNEIARQMNEVKLLNRRTKKPVWHATLSFAQNDHVTNAQMAEIAEKYTEFFGCKDNQYVAIKHNDTDHQHFHLIINRVDYSGKTLSDSNNYRKTSDFCRKMELQYKLEQVEAPNRFKNKNDRKERCDSRKNHLKQRVEDGLKLSQNFPELEKNLEKHGITFQKGRGIVFFDEKKVRVKGSEIGFSLKKVQKIFERKLDINMQKQLNKNRGLHL